MNAFSSSCKSKANVGINGIENIRKEIHVWKKFSDSFGLYFLIYFCSAQLMLIILAFNSLSKVVLGGFDLSSKQISWVCIFLSLGNQTRSDILQGQALFRGVKQMMTRGVWYSQFQKI